MPGHSASPTFPSGSTNNRGQRSPDASTTVPLVSSRPSFFGQGALEAEAPALSVLHQQGRQATSFPELRWQTPLHSSAAANVSVASPFVEVNVPSNAPHGLPFPPPAVGCRNPGENTRGLWLLPQGSVFLESGGETGEEFQRTRSPTNNGACNQERGSLVAYTSPPQRPFGAPRVLNTFQQVSPGLNAIPMAFLPDRRRTEERAPGGGVPFIESPGVDTPGTCNEGAAVRLSRSLPLGWGSRETASVRGASGGNQGCSEPGHVPSPLLDILLPRHQDEESFLLNQSSPTFLSTGHGANLSSIVLAQLAGQVAAQTPLSPGNETIGAALPQFQPLPLSPLWQANASEEHQRTLAFFQAFGPVKYIFWDLCSCPLLLRCPLAAVSSHVEKSTPEGTRIETEGAATAGSIVSRPSDSASSSLGRLYTPTEVVLMAARFFKVAVSAVKLFYEEDPDTRPGAMASRDRVSPPPFPVSPSHSEDRAETGESEGRVSGSPCRFSVGQNSGERLTSACARAEQRSSLESAGRQRLASSARLPQTPETVWQPGERRTCSGDARAKRTDVTAAALCDRLDRESRVVLSDMGCLVHECHRRRVMDCVVAELQRALVATRRQSTDEFSQMPRHSFLQLGDLEVLESSLSPSELPTIVILSSIHFDFTEALRTEIERSRLGETPPRVRLLVCHNYDWPFRPTGFLSQFIQRMDVPPQIQSAVYTATYRQLVSAMYGVPVSRLVPFSPLPAIHTNSADSLHEPRGGARNEEEADAPPALLPPVLPLCCTHTLPRPMGPSPLVLSSSASSSSLGPCRQGSFLQESRTATFFPLTSANQTSAFLSSGPALHHAADTISSFNSARPEASARSLPLPAPRARGDSSGPRSREKGGTCPSGGPLAPPDGLRHQEVEDTPRERQSAGRHEVNDKEGQRDSEWQPHSRGVGLSSREKEGAEISPVCPDGASRLHSTTQKSHEEEEVDGKDPPARSTADTREKDPSDSSLSPQEPSPSDRQSARPARPRGPHPSAHRCYLDSGEETREEGDSRGAEKQRDVPCWRGLEIDLRNPSRELLDFLGKVASPSVSPPIEEHANKDFQLLERCFSEAEKQGGLATCAAGPGDVEDIGRSCPRSPSFTRDHSSSHAEEAEEGTVDGFPLPLAPVIHAELPRHCPRVPAGRGTRPPLIPSPGEEEGAPNPSDKTLRGPTTYPTSPELSYGLAATPAPDRGEESSTESPSDTVQSRKPPAETVHSVVPALCTLAIHAENGEPPPREPPKNNLKPHSEAEKARSPFGALQPSLLSSVDSCLEAQRLADWVRSPHSDRVGSSSCPPPESPFVFHTAEIDTAAGPRRGLTEYFLLDTSEDESASQRSSSDFGLSHVQLPDQQCVQEAPDLLSSAVPLTSLVSSPPSVPELSVSLPVLEKIGANLSEAANAVEKQPLRGAAGGWEEANPPGRQGPDGVGSWVEGWTGPLEEERGRVGETETTERGETLRGRREVNSEGGETGWNEEDASVEREREAGPFGQCEATGESKGRKAMFLHPERQEAKGISVEAGERRGENRREGVASQLKTFKRETSTAGISRLVLSKLDEANATISTHTLPCSAQSDPRETSSASSSSASSSSSSSSSSFPVFSETRGRQTVMATGAPVPIEETDGVPFGFPELERNAVEGGLRHESSVSPSLSHPLSPASLFPAVSPSVPPSASPFASPAVSLSGASPSFLSASSEGGRPHLDPHSGLARGDTGTSRTVARRRVSRFRGSEPKTSPGLEGDQSRLSDTSADRGSSRSAAFSPAAYAEKEPSSGPNSTPGDTAFSFALASSHPHTRSSSLAFSSASSANAESLGGPLSSVLSRPAAVTPLRLLPEASPPPSESGASSAPRTSLHTLSLISSAPPPFPSSAFFPPPLLHRVALEPGPLPQRARLSVSSGAPSPASSFASFLSLPPGDALRPPRAWPGPPGSSVHSVASTSSISSGSSVSSASGHVSARGSFADAPEDRRKEDGRRLFSRVEGGQLRHLRRLKTTTERARMEGRLGGASEAPLHSRPRRTLYLQKDGETGFPEERKRDGISVNWGTKPTTGGVSQASQQASFFFAEEKKDSDAGVRLPGASVFTTLWNAFRNDKFFQEKRTPDVTSTASSTKPAKAVEPPSRKERTGQESDETQRTEEAEKIEEPEREGGEQENAKANGSNPDRGRPEVDHKRGEKETWGGVAHRGDVKAPFVPVEIPPDRPDVLRSLKGDERHQPPRRQQTEEALHGREREDVEQDSPFASRPPSLGPSPCRAPREAVDCLVRQETRNELSEEGEGERREEDTSKEPCDGEGETADRDEEGGKANQRELRVASKAAHDSAADPQRLAKRSDWKTVGDIRRSRGSHRARQWGVCALSRFEADSASAAEDHENEKDVALSGERKDSFFPADTPTRTGLSVPANVEAGFRLTEPTEGQRNERAANIATETLLGGREDEGVVGIVPGEEEAPESTDEPATSEEDRRGVVASQTPEDQETRAGQARKRREEDGPNVFTARTRVPAKEQEQLSDFFGDTNRDFHPCLYTDSTTHNEHVKTECWVTRSVIRRTLHRAEDVSALFSHSPEGAIFVKETPGDLEGAKLIFTRSLAPPAAFVVNDPFRRFSGQSNALVQSSPDSTNSAFARVSSLEQRRHFREAPSDRRRSASLQPQAPSSLPLVSSLTSVYVDSDERLSSPFHVDETVIWRSGPHLASLALDSSAASASSSSSSLFSASLAVAAAEHGAVSALPPHARLPFEGGEREGEGIPREDEAAGNASAREADVSEVPSRPERPETSERVQSTPPTSAAAPALSARRGRAAKEQARDSVGEATRERCQQLQDTTRRPPGSQEPPENEGNEDEQAGRVARHAKSRQAESALLRASFNSNISTLSDVLKEWTLAPLPRRRHKHFAASAEVHRGSLRERQSGKRENKMRAGNASRELEIRFTNDTSPEKGGKDTLAFSATAKRPLTSPVVPARQWLLTDAAKGGNTKNRVEESLTGRFYGMVNKRGDPENLKNTKADKAKRVARRLAALRVLRRCTRLRAHKERRLGLPSDDSTSSSRILPLSPTEFLASSATSASSALSDALPLLAFSYSSDALSSTRSSSSLSSSSLASSSALSSLLSSTLASSSSSSSSSSFASSAECLSSCSSSSVPSSPPGCAFVSPSAPAFRALERFSVSHSRLPCSSSRLSTSPAVSRRHLSASCLPSAGSRSSESYTISSFAFSSSSATCPQSSDSPSSVLNFNDESSWRGRGTSSLERGEAGTRPLAARLRRRMQSAEERLGAAECMRFLPHPLFFSGTEAGNRRPVQVCEPTEKRLAAQGEGGGAAGGARVGQTDEGVAEALSEAMNGPRGGGQRKLSEAEKPNPQLVTVRQRPETENDAETRPVGPERGDAQLHLKGADAVLRDNFRTRKVDQLSAEEMPLCSLVPLMRLTATDEGTTKALTSSDASAALGLLTETIWVESLDARKPGEKNTTQISVYALGLHSFPWTVFLIEKRLRRFLSAVQRSGLLGIVYAPPLCRAHAQSAIHLDFNFAAFLQDEKHKLRRPWDIYFAAEPAGSGEATRQTEAKRKEGRETGKRREEREQKRAEEREQSVESLETAQTKLAGTAEARRAIERHGDRDRILEAVNELRDMVWGPRGLLTSARHAVVDLSEDVENIARALCREARKDNKGEIKEEENGDQTKEEDTEEEEKERDETKRDEKEGETEEDELEREAEEDKLKASTRERREIQKDKEQADSRELLNQVEQQKQENLKRRGKKVRRRRRRRRAQDREMNRRNNHSPVRGKEQVEHDLKQGNEDQEQSSRILSGQLQRETEADLVSVLHEEEKTVRGDSEQLSYGERNVDAQQNEDWQRQELRRHAMLQSLERVLLRRFASMCDERDILILPFFSLRRPDAERFPRFFPSFSFPSVSSSPSGSSLPCSTATSSSSSSPSSSCVSRSLLSRFSSGRMPGSPKLFLVGSTAGEAERLFVEVVLAVKAFLSAGGDRPRKPVRRTQIISPLPPFSSKTSRDAESEQMPSRPMKHLPAVSLRSSSSSSSSSSSLSHLTSASLCSPLTDPVSLAAFAESTFDVFISWTSFPSAVSRLSPRAFLSSSPGEAGATAEKEVLLAALGWAEEDVENALAFVAAACDSRGKSSASPLCLPLHWHEGNAEEEPRKQTENGETVKAGKKQENRKECSSLADGQEAPLPLAFVQRLGTTIVQVPRDLLPLVFRASLTALREFFDDPRLGIQATCADILRAFGGTLLELDFSYSTHSWLSPVSFECAPCFVSPVLESLGVFFLLLSSQFDFCSLPVSLDVSLVLVAERRVAWRRLLRDARMSERCQTRGEKTTDRRGDSAKERRGNCEEDGEVERPTTMAGSARPRKQKGGNSEETRDKDSRGDSARETRLAELDGEGAEQSKLLTASAFPSHEAPLRSLSSSLFATHRLIFDCDPLYPPCQLAAIQQALALVRGPFYSVKGGTVASPVTTQFSHSGDIGGLEAEREEEQDGNGERTREEREEEREEEERRQGRKDEREEVGEKERADGGEGERDHWREEEKETVGGERDEDEKGEENRMMIEESGASRRAAALSAGTPGRGRPQRRETSWRRQTEGETTIESRPRRREMTVVMYNPNDVPTDLLLLITREGPLEAPDRIYDAIISEASYIAATEPDAFLLSGIPFGFAPLPHYSSYALSPSSCSSSSSSSVASDSSSSSASVSSLVSPLLSSSSASSSSACSATSASEFPAVPSWHSTETHEAARGEVLRAPETEFFTEKSAEAVEETSGRRARKSVNKEEGQETSQRSLARISAAAWETRTASPVRPVLLFPRTTSRCFVFRLGPGCGAQGRTCPSLDCAHERTAVRRFERLLSLAFPPDADKKEVPLSEFLVPFDLGGRFIGPGGKHRKHLIARTRGFLSVSNERHRGPVGRSWRRLAVGGDFDARLALAKEVFRLLQWPASSAQEPGRSSNVKAHAKNPTKALLDLFSLQALPRDRLLGREEKRERHSEGENEKKANSPAFVSLNQKIPLETGVARLLRDLSGGLVDFSFRLVVTLKGEERNENFCIDRDLLRLHLERQHLSLVRFEASSLAKGRTDAAEAKAFQRNAAGPEVRAANKDEVVEGGQDLGDELRTTLGDREKRTDADQSVWTSVDRVDRREAHGESSDSSSTATDGCDPASSSPLARMQSKTKSFSVTLRGTREALNARSAAAFAFLLEDKRRVETVHFSDGVQWFFFLPDVEKGRGPGTCRSEGRVGEEDSLEEKMCDSVGDSRGGDDQVRRCVAQHGSETPACGSRPFSSSSASSLASSLRPSLSPHSCCFSGLAWVRIHEGEAAVESAWQAFLSGLDWSGRGGALLRLAGREFFFHFATCTAFPIIRRRRSSAWRREQSREGACSDGGRKEEERNEKRDIEESKEKDGLVQNNVTEAPAEDGDDLRQLKEEKAFFESTRLSGDRKSSSAHTTTRCGMRKREEKAFPSVSPEPQCLLSSSSLLSSTSPANASPLPGRQAEQARTQRNAKSEKGKAPTENTGNAFLRRDAEGGDSLSEEEESGCETAEQMTQREVEAGTENGNEESAGPNGRRFPGRVNDAMSLNKDEITFSALSNSYFLPLDPQCSVSAPESVPCVSSHYCILHLSSAQRVPSVVTASEAKKDSALLDAALTASLENAERRHPSRSFSLDFSRSPVRLARVEIGECRGERRSRTRENEDRVVERTEKEQAVRGGGVQEEKRGEGSEEEEQRRTRDRGRAATSNRVQESERRAAGGPSESEGRPGLAGRKIVTVEEFCGTGQTGEDDRRTTVCEEVENKRSVSAEKETFHVCRDVLLRHTRALLQNFL